MLLGQIDWGTGIAAEFSFRSLHGNYSVNYHGVRAPSHGIPLGCLKIRAATPVGALLGWIHRAPGQCTNMEGRCCELVERCP